MTMRRFAIICGLAAFASLAVAATSWRYYANDRFGVSAEVPANWREEPPPANDDGRIFDSPDGKAQIIVNGGFVMEESAALALETLAKPRGGERVTYTKRGALSVTLSGLSGDNIFYRRTILTCSGKVWNNLEINYPASEKAAYDGIVAHAAASLHGGAPAGMQCGA
jgi:serine/threonine-protein kinase